MNISLHDGVLLSSRIGFLGVYKEYNIQYANSEWENFATIRNHAFRKDRRDLVKMLTISVF